MAVSKAYVHYHSEGNDPGVSFLRSSKQRLTRNQTGKTSARSTHSRLRQWPFDGSSITEINAPLNQFSDCSILYQHTKSRCSAWQKVIVTSNWLHLKRTCVWLRAMNQKMFLFEWNQHNRILMSHLFLHLPFSWLYHDIHNFKLKQRDSF